MFNWQVTHTMVFEHDLPEAFRYGKYAGMF